MIAVLTCTDIRKPGASQQLPRGREGVVVGDVMSPGGRRVTSRVHKQLQSSDSKMRRTSTDGHKSKSRPHSMLSAFPFRESPHYMFHVQRTPKYICAFVSVIIIGT